MAILGKIMALYFLLAVFTAYSQQSFQLAGNGKTDYLITVAADASIQEKFAAEELASYLEKISGAKFQIKAPGSTGNSPVIAVGPGAATYVDKAVAEEIAGLGQEGILIKASGKNIILTGGRDAMRGTIYSVYTFLEDFAGVRWWTDKVTYIPSSPSLDIKPSQIKYIPKFEYREIFIYCAYDNNWQIHNKCNGGNTYAAGHCASGFKSIPPEHGGCLVIKGFAHTMPGYVAPQDLYFKEHPEWFAEIKGKRTNFGPLSQLCLSNKELLEHFIKKVRVALKKSSPDTVISITQGDSETRCQCKECMKIEAEEGSGSGPVIRFVNAIADDIKKDYPDVKIDTFAYLFSRQPCKTKPHDNVVIRLADIECSFSKPLYDKVNKSFASDLKKWAAVSKKIYIWDYVTNFHNYLAPFPNLRVLGPNLKLMSENNVKGVFEQGSFQSPGGEFAELRAWVLAKLLWNPELDSEKLIDEFIVGYYGEAAPFIKEYINLIHDSVEKDNFYLDVYLTWYISPDVLSSSDELFRKAEKAVAGKSEIVKRVQAAHMPVLISIIMNYSRIQQLMAVAGAESRVRPQMELYNEFLKYYKDAGGTTIDESHRIPNPVDWTDKYPIVRNTTAQIPSEFKMLPRSDWCDLQDNAARLYSLGKLVTVEKDKMASDGYAARMPSDHKDWAVQMQLPVIAGDDEWSVYVAVKAVPGKKDDKKVAFTAGIYNKSKAVADRSIGVLQKDLSSGYKLYKVGTCKLKSLETLVWIAPGGEKEYFDSVWVDRVFLVRNKK